MMNFLVQILRDNKVTRGEFMLGVILIFGATIGLIIFLTLISIAFID